MAEIDRLITLRRMQSMRPSYAALFTPQPPLFTHVCGLTRSLVQEIVSTSLGVATWGYWAGALVPNYIRSQILFRQDTRFGQAVCFLVMMSLVCVTSLLHMKEKVYQANSGHASSSDPTKGVNALIVVFGVPFMQAVSYHTSGYQKSGPHTHSPVQAYFAFLPFAFMEVCVAFLYVWYLLPLFFDATINETDRFIIRISGSIIAIKVVMEAAWKMSAYCTTYLAVDIQVSISPHIRMHTNTHAHTHFCFQYPLLTHVPSQDAPLLVSVGATILPLLARLMQGSAETVRASIIYEVAGTLAELSLADALLKGRTPIDNLLKNFFWAGRIVCRLAARLRFKSNRVGVEGGDEEEDGEEEEGGGDGVASLTERDKQRIVFAETAMVSACFFTPFSESPLIYHSPLTLASLVPRR